MVAGLAGISETRFSTLADRLVHQDALDAAIGAWAATQTAEDVMLRLAKDQAFRPRGVPEFRGPL